MCEHYPMPPDAAARAERNSELLRKLNRQGMHAFAKGGLILPPPTDTEIYAEVKAARAGAEKRDAWRRSVGLLPPLHAHTKPITEES